MASPFGSQSLSFWNTHVFSLSPARTYAPAPTPQLRESLSKRDDVKEGAARRALRSREQATEWGLFLANTATTSCVLGLPWYVISATKVGRGVVLRRVRGVLGRGRGGRRRVAGKNESDGVGEPWQWYGNVGACM